VADVNGRKGGDMLFGLFWWTSECRECILRAQPALAIPQDWEIWDGKCFTRTSLIDQGFVLHVGHGSHQCPSQTTAFGRR